MRLYTCVHKYGAVFMSTSRKLNVGAVSPLTFVDARVAYCVLDTDQWSSSTIGIDGIPRVLLESEVDAVEWVCGG